MNTIDDFMNVTTDACGIDEHWTRIILILRCGIAGSGLLSCVFVLILAAYFICKDRDVIHVPTLRLVMYITVSSMARSIIIVVQIIGISTLNFSNFYYCMITGYFYRTTSFVAILFTLMASVHTLVATFGKFYKRLEPFYILVPLVLPQMFVWVPFVYDKALMEAWCSIKSDNDTCNQKLMGFIYNVDIPRLVIEFINTILVIITIIRMPYQYRKLRSQEQTEDFKIWLQQVIPILVYTTFYLFLNWFSLTDHVNRKFKWVKAESLKVTHSVTSASHGLVVGIVFTAYLLIMLYISMKYKGQMDDQCGEYEHLSASELSDSVKSENTPLLENQGQKDGIN